jgi:hypothetical protein
LQFFLSLIVDERIFDRGYTRFGLLHLRAKIVVSQPYQRRLELRRRTRVPVKIVPDSGQATIALLRPGLG